MNDLVVFRLLKLARGLTVVPILEFVLWVSDPSWSFSKNVPSRESNQLKMKDNKFTYVLHLYRICEIKIGIVVLIFSGSSYVVEVAWYVLGYVVEVVYRVTSWK